MNDPYTTSDTSLAAFLDYKGNKMVGLMQDPNDSRRKVFVFIKEDNTLELEEEYNAGIVPVHLMLYYKSIRKMHHTLKYGELIK